MPRLYHLDFRTLAPLGNRLARGLAPEERARRSRYVTDELQERFANGRGALRLLLADATGTPPSGVQLITERWGKPRMRSSRGRGDVHFNVSHTDRVLLVAIGDSPIGIDVARVEECSEFPGLEAQLTDPELHRLRRVAPSHRQEVLAEFWTRKEAVLKAVGCGLRLPLSALDVTQPIVQSAELSGELRWRVMTARLDAEHVWSLAVSDDKGTSLSAEVVNLSSTMAILHEQLANAEAGDT